ncbi:limbin isoform X4 [Gallus gallus]|uniref:limbin isoform X4 n=1 Tax=Gallus gallus TaxID=9031 RepID=UPI001EFFE892|nr:limbin isoform X4 [Gallus gallus]
MDAKAEARSGSGQRGAPRAGPVPCGAGRLLAGLLVVLLSSAPAQPLGAAAWCPTQGHGVPGPPRGHCGRTAAGVITDDPWLQKEMNCLRMTALQLPVVVQASEVPDLILTSAASEDQWSHSIFALISSWTRKILFKRESSVNHQLSFPLPPQPEDVSNLSASSGFGITLQKCAVVDVEHDPQTAYIRLLINNTNSLLSRNITDLILLDNITGLHVQKDSGNETRDGMQIYRKRFLQVGEYFAINYTALLDAKKTWKGRVLTLPAQLTFRSSSQNQTDLVSLTTLFTITEEEKTEVSYSHAIHASGFFIAFFVSLVLTCAVFFILYRTQLLRWSFYSENQEIQHELSQNHKLEHSQFSSGDLFSEDVIMNDQIIDILTFEESGNMLQALEEAGHLHESHLGMLLDRAEAEINSVKQKFNHDLKQEKQKLQQKLITKRKWKMLQKKEHWKEQLSIGNPFKTSREITDYLSHWKTVLSDHAIEFEELTEKLDNEGSEELRDLIFNLAEKTVEELKLVQYGVFVQELIKLSVPKMFLLEVVEEHKKEFIVKREHLEREEREKIMAAEELLQLTRQKLSQELESSLSQQKKLRNWEQSVFMQLLTLPLSLSEEELLKMRQEFHCCFSQLDSSLALPKIRARALLQAFELEWRDAQLLKVSQNLAMTNKQLHSKTKKTGSKNRNKIDVLKKSLQDKIFIYEDSVKVENLTKVNYELLLEKDCQIHDLENKLGEYIASLEFQKSVKKCKMLELYAAVISVQGLLLENLSMSKTLSKSECIQILEAHNPEIEELDRKLEYEMLHKESAQQQQHLMNKQRWTPDGLRPSSEVVETNVDRQVTFLLRQAMNRCMQFINLHRQSLRDEQWNCMVLEDLLENIEMDAFLALYSQELRLAGYLARLTRVPMGMLHRILNLLLPSSSQSEVLSILDSIGVYSDGAAESDSNADESGSCKKRRNQECWQALEYKVREDLVTKSLERILSLNRRKDSLIKKKQLALLERPSFVHLESLPTRPPVERSSPHVSFNSVTAEAIELLDTGEKIFLFRDRSDPTLSFHNYPRKKKKNFLNSKKAARANIN